MTVRIKIIGAPFNRLGWVGGIDFDKVLCNLFATTSDAYEYLFVAGDPIKFVGSALLTLTYPDFQDALKSLETEKDLVKEVGDQVSLSEDVLKQIGPFYGRVHFFDRTQNVAQDVAMVFAVKDDGGKSLRDVGTQFLNVAIGRSLEERNEKGDLAFKPTEIFRRWLVYDASELLMTDKYVLFALQRATGRTGLFLNIDLPKSDDSKTFLLFHSRADLLAKRFDAFKAGTDSPSRRLLDELLYFLAVDREQQRIAESDASGSQLTDCAAFFEVRGTLESGGAHVLEVKITSK